MGSVNDITAAHMLPPPEAGGVMANDAANIANAQGSAAGQQAAGSAAAQAATNANAMGAIQPGPPAGQVAGAMSGALAQGFQNMAAAPTGMLPVRQAPTMPMLMQSDERSKESIDRSDMGEMLDTIKPVSWDYKDPEAHGQGRHWGFMAQDAQKSPAGASMIVPTAQGLMVDTRKAATLGLAAAAFNHRRIAALEAAIKKGKAS